MTSDSRAALVAEALRVNGRYLEEVVLGWGLCPWAERAIRDGRVERRVRLEERPSCADLLAVVDELEALPDAAIGLVIFPRAALAAAAFDSFAEKVRRADRARRRSADIVTPFLMAAFHPFAASAFNTAPELVSFVRRTPDPTLQLVRASLLEGLPAGVSDEVGRQNFADVSARGATALDALLRDIRSDRDRSYARCGAASV